MKRHIGSKNFKNEFKRLLLIFKHCTITILSNSAAMGRKQENKIDAKVQD